MQTNLHFKDKFIGFIDVLGFKSMVESAEKGSGPTLDDLLLILKEMVPPEGRKNYLKHGPTTCPQSSYINFDLDFQLTQLSDSLIVSSEVSPAGVINLLNHCWVAVLNLLIKGVMCRGYITRGKIHHTDSHVIGSGYQKAYSREREVAAFKRVADERGTPFVEVDSVICDYVSNSDDACVKKLFARMVKSDGETVAIFPFQMLAHSFMIAGYGVHFDPHKEKEANDNMRLFLNDLKGRIMKYVDQSNPKAVKKAELYIKSLDDQIAKCKQTDEIIDLLTGKRR
jgi:hypothetical protein